MVCKISDTKRQPHSLDGLSRRNFLALGAALTGGTLLSGSKPAQASERIKTKARIVIAGAGAAGLSAAAQLANRLEGATITIFDARKDHYYQPGFTLVAAGLKPMDYSISATADYIPSGVSWVPEAITEFDPVGNKVVTEKGQSVAYDFLIVATGL